MTMLKERYIDAVLEHVPDDQKDEMSREIRAAVDEMIDQRVETGELLESATEDALNELGDPEKLAMSYQERPRYLIGPGWYPSYISMLKKIPAVVLPFVAVITLLVGIGIDQKGLSEAIQGAVESVIGAAIQILFWITLGFAIAERTVGPEMPSKENKRWTVADLPEAPARRQITLGGVVPDIVAMFALAVLAWLQFARGIGFFVRGAAESVQDVSLINPDLAWGWMAAFFALVSFSIAAAVVRYLRGFWTRPVAMLEIADSVLWAIYVVALAASAPIVNPAFAERVDEGSRWWATGGQANTLIAIAVIVISVQTAWDAWRGHREYMRMRAHRTPSEPGTVVTP